MHVGYINFQIDFITAGGQKQQILNVAEKHGCVIRQYGSKNSQSSLDSIAKEGLA